MNIEIIAVGDKMPGWVKTGASEYLKRLPSHFQVTFIEIPLQKRNKGQETKARQKESESMLGKLSSKAYIIALEASGKKLSSELLASTLEQLSHSTSLVQILIGGPEGLSKECLEKAHVRWSLSALTFPHPLVRIILCEALYRSHSIINNHPYHK